MVPVFGKQNQDRQKFKAFLCYIMSSKHKTLSNKEQQQHQREAYLFLFEEKENKLTLFIQMIGEGGLIIVYAG
jgi:hypothetical protein